MSSFLEGFADELTKTAVVGKGVLNIVKKHPIRSLLAAGVLGSTAIAASSAHKSGLRGGEKGRYLAATRDRPSRAALTDYHKLFKHKPSRKEVDRLSKHHKASRFSQYSSRRNPRKDKS